MAGSFPNSSFAGYDLAHETVAYARSEAREGHTNARFEARDLSHFDEQAEPGVFDLVIYTISCVHCMTVSLAQGGEGLGAM